MALEGVWTTEVCGPFGWECVGVLVMGNGAAAGGNNNHFSIGRYSEVDGNIEIELMIDFYGTPRSIFGVKEKTLEVRITGTWDGEMIAGTAYRPQDPGLSVECRLRRRAELPGGFSKSSA